MNVRSFVKSLFTFLSLIQAFKVRLKWDKGGDAFLLPKEDCTVLAFYFGQLITFITVPTFLYALSVKWKYYLENGLYFHLSYHCLWITVIFACESFQWIFIKLDKPIITLVNQTIALRNRLQRGTFAFNTFEKDKRFSFLLVALLGACYIGDMSTVLMPLFALSNRESWYITSYILRPLYENQKTAGLAFVLAFLFEFWWLSVQWAGMCLLGYVHFLYLTTMTTSLTNLRRMIANQVDGGSGKSEDGEGRADVFMKSVLTTYMKLRVLSGMYNRSLGKYFLPYFKTTLGFCGIGGLFLLVKLFVIRSYIIIGFSAICLVLVDVNLMVISKLCALLNCESLKLKHDLIARNYRGKKARVWIRSFKVIGVDVGIFYSIIRSTPLTILSTMSNLGATLIISVEFTI